MLFSGILKEDGCVCVGCGPSQYEGIATIVKREDGQYDNLLICSKCLFTGGISMSAWNKFLGKKDEPTPMPDPEPIKPRWFG